VSQPSAGAMHEDLSWRDIESRIQYGYYTEDVPALHRLEETVRADESHEPLHGYYTALLSFRLAQLAALAPGGRAAAAPAAQRCLSDVDALLAAQADFAEGLALRAACRASVAQAEGMQGAFGLQRAHRDLERALQRAPHNPRVLLVDGLNDYELTPAQGGNKERALTKLRRAVAAFEVERTGIEPLPGWGAAEAYLALARALIDHGEAVAARDALEHSLLLAPEFAQARRLLAQITGG
jgi:hypothetical protein